MFASNQFQHDLIASLDNNSNNGTCANRLLPSLSNILFQFPSELVAQTPSINSILLNQYTPQRTANSLMDSILMDKSLSNTLSRTYFHAPATDPLLLIHNHQDISARLNSESAHARPSHCTVSSTAFAPIFPNKEQPDYLSIDKTTTTHPAETTSAAVTTINTTTHESSSSSNILMDIPHNEVIIVPSNSSSSASSVISGGDIATSTSAAFHHPIQVVLDDEEDQSSYDYSSSASSLESIQKRSSRNRQTSSTKNSSSNKKSKRPNKMKKIHLKNKFSSSDRSVRIKCNRIIPASSSSHSSEEKSSISQTSPSVSATASSPVVEKSKNISYFISYDDIKKQFYWPECEAAKRLGCSKSKLKRMKTKLNIERWPYRRIQSLLNLKSGNNCTHSAETIDLAVDFVVEHPNLITKYANQDILLTASRFQRIKLSNLL